MVVDIIHTANQLDYKISLLLKTFSITHVQFNILKILQGANPQPLSAGQIKERILFSNSDITRLIDRLVKKELVDRIICPNNRRKMDISITKKGTELLNKIEPELSGTLNDFFKNEIKVEDAKLVSETLKKIRAEQ